MRQRRSSSLTATERYLTEFRSALTLFLRRQARPDDLADIVQSECVAVLKRLDSTMNHFPDPQVLARVRASNGRAVLDYRRTQRAQRAEGAAQVRNEHGELVRGREVVPGTSPVRPMRDGYPSKRPGLRQGPGTYFDAAVAHDTDPADIVADRDLVERLLLTIAPDQREIVRLVDTEGYTVTEVAGRLGIRRETAARKRSAAYQAIGVRPPC